MDAQPDAVSAVDAAQTALISQLAAAVAQLVKRAIFVEVNLWDIAMIAQFLKRNPRAVRERMACPPSFPKAVRLPTTTRGKLGKTQPMYWAKEVIAWAKSHQEKH